MTGSTEDVRRLVRKAVEAKLAKLRSDDERKRTASAVNEARFVTYCEVAADWFGLATVGAGVEIAVVEAIRSAGWVAPAGSCSPGRREKVETIVDAALSCDLLSPVR